MVFKEHNRSAHAMKLLQTQPPKKPIPPYEQSGRDQQGRRGVQVSPKSSACVNETLL